MKLHELLEVMTNDFEAGYITVVTKRGSVINRHCGPGFIYHTYKDRDVISVRPYIIVSELGESARPGIIITVEE